LDDAVKPFFATPAYGAQVTTLHHASMVELCTRLAKSGVEPTLGLLDRESLVLRARNELLARFLETPCDRLFFIDADIGFRPEDVASVLRTDLDFIVGPYLKKLPGPPEWTVRLKRDGTVQLRELEGKARYLEIDDGPGGFMCLSRECVERLWAEAPEYPGGTRDHPIRCRDVFRCDVGPGGYMGEDFALCRRWRQDFGGSVWLAIDVELVHVGSYPYRARFPLAAKSTRELAALAEGRPTEPPPPAAEASP
jgi:hypothetical protein